jgi:hypothetical protein
MSVPVRAWRQQADTAASERTPAQRKSSPLVRSRLITCSVSRSMLASTHAAVSSRPAACRQRSAGARAGCRAPLRCTASASEPARTRAPLAQRAALAAAATALAASLCAAPAFADAEALAAADATFDGASSPLVQARPAPWLPAQPPQRSADVAPARAWMTRRHRK